MYVGRALTVNARTSGALDDVLCRAGAVFAAREGHRVAVSYGSPAGELAACVSWAGISDSSHLTKLELLGPAQRLAALVGRVTDRTLAPGGVAVTGGAWWCAADVAPSRVVVLCEPSQGVRLRDLLSVRAAQLPGLELHDRSDQWGAITIIGAATAGVLADVGVYGASGDSRQVPPFTSVAIAGIDASWLLVSEHRAVALTRSGDAGALWHAIERAGRARHMCCVGSDAIARYELLERRSAHARAA